MKRVTASEARRNWFRILDEVAGGEIVCVERGGSRILIQREAATALAADVPDYDRLLRVQDPDRADLWGWVWTGPDGDLDPVDEGEGG